MHAVFVIPGIMGTELFLGSEKVWPPTPLETQLGYKRGDKLADPAVTHGKIIRSVLCFDFYKPLLGQLDVLGFKANSTTQPLYEFPYDWRHDLFDLAAKLAALLDHAHAQGAKKMSLVAHSMGGLISRLLIEDPAYRARPWFGMIDQLVAIATPHLGAPLALGRVLGRDSAMGISGADFAKLTGNVAYPSGYQLLPAPGEASCWNQSDAELAAIDIYSAAGMMKLGLNPVLVARAKALHDMLGAGNQPTGIRYFYFAGAGHRTATRVNIFTDAAGAIKPGMTQLTLTESGGDGTVPMYSALPRRGQRQIVTNEHATAFKGGPFNKVFVRLLGGNAGPALERIFVQQLEISIESPVVTVGEEIEVLLYDAEPNDNGAGRIAAVHGELVLVLVRDGTKKVEIEMQRVRVDYDGPTINRLRFYLAGVRAPGHYVLRFDGLPSAPAVVPFSACAKLELAGSELLPSGGP